MEVKESNGNSLAALTIFTACSDRQMYDDKTRSRCLEGANMRYRQYRRERDKDPVNANEEKKP